ncbi:hypothetical protein lerEdw1_003095 [Lerista edwardsae]|nr:hypothetical protein lerEdw1_003095 [Lerista edwardsae]
MVLLSHRDSRRRYLATAGTDCRLTLQAASPRDQVQFQFRFFLVHSERPGPASPSNEPRAPGSSTPGPCPGGSYVQFYDGQGRAARPRGTPLCGTTIPLPVLSSGSLLTVRLVTRGEQPRVDFVGTVVSVRTGLSASACTVEGYFPCRPGRCIPRSLVCSASHVESCGGGPAPAVVGSPAWCKGRPLKTGSPQASQPQGPFPYQASKQAGPVPEEVGGPLEHPAVDG